MTFSSLRVQNEVNILRSVKHPCVINLEDVSLSLITFYRLSWSLQVIDTKDYLFIILELAEGGELFDKIIEKSSLDEDAAKLYFFQIASAIEYLHSRVRICTIFALIKLLSHPRKFVTEISSQKIFCSVLWTTKTRWWRSLIWAWASCWWIRPDWRPSVGRIRSPPIPFFVFTFPSPQDPAVHRSRDPEGWRAERWRADVPGEELLPQGGLLESRGHPLHPPVGQSSF